jgi:hypothetical protein
MKGSLSSSLMKKLNLTRSLVSSKDLSVISQQKQKSVIMEKEAK